MNKFLDWVLFANVPKEEYKQCEPELVANNYKMLNILTIVSTIFFGTCGILGFFVTGMEDKRLSYLLGAATSLVAFFINILFGKKKLGSVLSVIVFDISAFGAAALITLVDAKDQLTITLIPLLTIIPTLFVVKPWKTNAIVLMYMVIYLVVAPFVKPKDILLLDIVDVVLFGLVGMILGMLGVRNNLKRMHMEKNAIKARNSVVGMLNSFSSAYNSMHFIHLRDNYVIEFSTNDKIKRVTDTKGDVAEMMRVVMRNTISEEYLKEVLEFTDLDLLPGKLFGNKSISIDVLGKYHGWQRLEFIAIEVDDDGVVLSVIFTTRSIAKEKEKEDELIQESMMDELTKCYNRKAFEADFKNVKIGSDSEHAYLSLDVNGLKVVNDSKGHAAGDELICGAAECMQKAFGKFGRVYRNGGDEFSVLIKADEELLFNLVKNFHSELSNWKGNLVSNLAVSVGAVVIKNINAKTHEDVVMLADKLMYEDKDRYYARKGVSRKDETDAFISICRTYTKILKCSLMDDTFRIISYDGLEDNPDKYNGSLSPWLITFGNSDMIHEEDRSHFLEMMDIDKLRKQFLNNCNNVMIKYRRRNKDIYEDSVLEIIKTQDFTSENLNVYICVKSINK